MCVQATLKALLGGKHLSMAERAILAQLLPEEQAGLLQQLADSKKGVAAERIADLNERGYANAGLYDPPGVGGTHVMYVLQHADRPEIYHGLPSNPTISPMVSLWMGALKPLALVAMGAAALAGFFHYIKEGPNDADRDDNEPPSPSEVKQREGGPHV